VRLGLLGREPPGADHLVDERVIVRQTLEVTAAQAIRAAVAHVGDRDLAVADGERGHGRAHAGERVVLLGKVVDALVRLLDARGQLALAHVLGVLQPGELVDRCLGGHLAGARAAHAIGNREQAGAG
jgi:hypothetical protein